jgi:TonB-dependent receptor
MTRPNPNTMLPGLNFSSPSADTGSVGNPALKPYLSNNIDFGWEYYTGAEGYFGMAAFRKTVKGFTVNGNTTHPFSDLAAYGVTYNTLTPIQQGSIDARGGPGAATVVLTEQVNASGLLYVDGLEFNWVQPLDFLVDSVGMNALDGLGFTANATIVDQRGSGAAPAIAVGVSPWTANVTGYYENHGATVRASYVYNAKTQNSGANQNGIPLAALWGNQYGEWDLSSSYELNRIFDVPGNPELTFDIINVTDAKQRSYFQFNSAAFTYYDPGRQVMVGIRGNF